MTGRSSTSSTALCKADRQRQQALVHVLAISAIATVTCSGITGTFSSTDQLWVVFFTAVPCCWCVLADARCLPHGRNRARDRHLKFDETRDNLAEAAVTAKEQVGFDFAIAESGVFYDECSSYTELHGPHVLDIEYTDALRIPFNQLCSDPDRVPMTVLRDRDRVPAGDAPYE
jgi:hypothetical protein